MEHVAKFFDDLIHPGNTAYLVVFCINLVVFFTALIVTLVLFLRRHEIDETFKLFFVKVRIFGGKDILQQRRYRKLLYIKVLYLSDRSAAVAPFYTREVPRLNAGSDLVPVYDEAVYYTLKLFPDTRTTASAKDHSTGVVDPRLLIPWDATASFNHDTLGAVQQIAEFGLRSSTDTMLTASHFLNGMQAKQQSFCTYADEDTESLRMVLDFSSILNANQIVKFQSARLWYDGSPVETDNVSFADLGCSVFMAHCRDAKRGSTLRIDVTLTTWPDSADAKPGSPCN